VEGTVTSSRKFTASMESKERRSSSSLYSRSLPSPSSVAFKLDERQVVQYAAGIILHISSPAAHLILTKSFMR